VNVLDTCRSTNVIVVVDDLCDDEVCGDHIAQHARQNVKSDQRAERAPFVLNDHIVCINTLHVGSECCRVVVE